MKTKPQLNETSIEASGFQEKPIAIAVRNALKSYNERELWLIENPLSEFWVRTLEILDMKRTITPEEWEKILWDMFWHNMSTVIKEDKLNQARSMLSQFWLWKPASNDERFSIAA